MKLQDLFNAMNIVETKKEVFCCDHMSCSTAKTLDVLLHVSEILL